MLTRMKIHGFRTLVGTELLFDPLTIMIGKNGAGKTSILDSLQIIGNFARGGVSRAFGPPPWSLGWQRTKGIGQIHAVTFDCDVSIPDGKRYAYHLALSERDGDPVVVEERILRLPTHAAVASYEFSNPPPSGSILSPAKSSPHHDEIQAIGNTFKSVISYELNPSEIERGNDSSLSQVGRDGAGVAAFLARLDESDRDGFEQIEECIKMFRPETDAVEVWSAGSSLFWGLRSTGQSRSFPALHLSWGDRQLVGLLCVLFQNSRTIGNTIAIEEIDRGFHPSRYTAVIDLLSKAAYEGIFGGQPHCRQLWTHPQGLKKSFSAFVPTTGDLDPKVQEVSENRCVVHVVEQIVFLVAVKLTSQFDGDQHLHDLRWQQRKTEC